MSQERVLVIDDESDHGSVDTGEDVVDENGKPDLEHQPTTINRLIRSILNHFARSAYVGYTATPFANIFIHDKGTTEEHGPDLFPAAFITNLAAQPRRAQQEPGELVRSDSHPASWQRKLRRALHPLGGRRVDQNRFAGQQLARKDQGGRGF